MEKICNDSIYLNKIDSVIYKKESVILPEYQMQNNLKYKLWFDVRDYTQKILAIRFKSIFKSHLKDSQTLHSANWTLTPNLHFSWTWFQVWRRKRDKNTVFSSLCLSLNFSSSNESCNFCQTVSKNLDTDLWCLLKRQAVQYRWRTGHTFMSHCCKFFNKWGWMGFFSLFFKILKYFENFWSSLKIIWLT